MASHIQSRYSSEGDATNYVGVASIVGVAVWENPHKARTTAGRQSFPGNVVISAIRVSVLLNVIGAR